MCQRMIYKVSPPPLLPPPSSPPLPSLSLHYLIPSHLFLSLRLFYSPSSPLLPFVFSSFFSLFPLLTFLIHLLPIPFSLYPIPFYTTPLPLPITSSIGLLDFSSPTPLRPATGPTPRSGEEDILEGLPYLSWRTRVQGDGQTKWVYACICFHGNHLNTRELLFFIMRLLLIFWY